MTKMNSNDLAKKVEELVSLRKSLALELKSIARSTKIPTQTLKNIELGNFAKLPPFPIGQSFIKQYEYFIEEELSNSKNAKVRSSNR